MVEQEEGKGSRHKVSFRGGPWDGREILEEHPRNEYRKRIEVGASFGPHVHVYRTVPTVEPKEWLGIYCGVKEGT